MIPALNSIIGRLHAKQLRLLVALADHGSLLNAAREVSTSQPAASKALREIESIFGTELFIRTNRGLEPTRAGHSVIRHARLFHADMDNLRAELISVLHGCGGRVSAGTVMGAVPLVTAAVTALMDRQPQVSVEVLEETSATLLAQLDEGRIELAVCRTSVTNVPNRFRSVVLQDETLTVIANKKHPLASATVLAVADLADARWVVYRANMPIRRLLEREFHEAGLRMPPHLIETTSAFATLSLLQRSACCVALLPTTVAEFCKSLEWACELPLTVSSRTEPYELVTRRGATLSPEAQLLIAALTGVPDIGV
ncbi:MULTISPECIES: LysR family transcriptional regulator [Paraburkholderia]|uniref:LysR family transcriptional regulator n=1 Tax=Paraburkholderia TaxID=1822464 RepID=UPI002AB73432|nr:MULTISPECIES: LysR family transcriptional regulator [Paraburkholderia]